MPSGASANKIFDLERSILKALCLGQAATSESARRSLAVHTWQDQEHRVVYEALQRLRTHDPEFLRERLPAQATRMGFPDVDWHTYFAPADVSVDIEQLIRELAATLAKRQ
ncbi:MAG: hypothetical protein ACRD4Q_02710 [Candidatus Acidiferrales bacterium]